MREIIQLFPFHLQTLLNDSLHFRWDDLEEIRLRLNCPIELNFHQHVEWVKHTIFTEADRDYLLNQLSEHSLYRLEEELREGYITIRGGHRVGIAGHVTLQNREVKQLTFITFFNIRIAREMIGIAETFLPYLQNKQRYFHTLIVGAPQSGKTTMLRDLARLMSNGGLNLQPQKVAIVDERSEIAACKNGIPQHHVGLRTDVLDACPKAIGMMMMIRSMSPQVLFVDEIGKQQDVEALMDVLYAGVTVICSVHGASLAEVKNRLFLKPLFQENTFERFLFLQKRADGAFYVQIENDRGEQIHAEMVKRK